MTALACIVWDTYLKMRVRKVPHDDEVSLEAYTGNAFTPLEMVSSDHRHHGTMLTMRAIGTIFNWTLNQEVVFSAALTGKPERKEDFVQLCWKRCVIGTLKDYAMALFQGEWDAALQSGDLSLLRDENDEPLIFCAANNTEYLNVAAYLEACWGDIWPTLNHNHEPQLGHGQHRSVVV